MESIGQCMNNWDFFENFSRDEFACQCGCGKADMKAEFMLQLQRLRTSCGFPFKISSGYRCPEHNNKVSSSGYEGPHTTGLAVDISVAGEQARTLINKSSGFSGIGISQKGNHANRFIHLDNLETAAGRPRPWVWSY